MPTFTPPVVADRAVGMFGDGPISLEELQAVRFGMHLHPTDRGVNVWQLANGTFTERQPPNNVGVVKVYLGGHSHPITNAEAAALTAAGYGGNIT